MDVDEGGYDIEVKGTIHFHLQLTTEAVQKQIASVSVKGEGATMLIPGDHLGAEQVSSHPPSPNTFSEPSTLTPDHRKDRNDPFRTETEPVVVGSSIGRGEEVVSVCVCLGGLQLLHGARYPHTVLVEQASFLIRVEKTAFKRFILPSPPPHPSMPFPASCRFPITISQVCCRGMGQGLALL